MLRQSVLRAHNLKAGRHLATVPQRSPLTIGASRVGLLPSNRKSRVGAARQIYSGGRGLALPVAGEITQPGKAEFAVLQAVRMIVGIIPLGGCRQCREHHGYKRCSSDDLAHLNLLPLPAAASGIATAATVHHGAGGAAGLPRSIEVYALPRNCAIERSEAHGVFDGARPAGAARLPGSFRVAFQRLRETTRKETSRNIFAYIEGFYHRTRRHSAIGCIGPIEMEPKAATLFFFGARSRLRFSGMNQQQGSSP
jgi:hypothetical protein